MSSGNPIQLNYLVFDDEDEEQNQNSIQVKIPGVACKIIFVNPKEFYDPTSDIFNIDAFKERIHDVTKGHYISLVATDWNMLHKTANYGEINGIEIVDILLGINDKYRKCPFLIYSGKPSEASSVLISKIRQEIDTEPAQHINSLQLLSLLLELQIKFCSRVVRFTEIKRIMIEEKAIPAIVLNLLNNFEKNIVVNTGNEYFDGRTLESLIELISQDDDLGLKFIREFIELSIANYTELNAN